MVLGVVTWFYLTDRPEQARWLSAAEREWLSARMAREERHREERHGLSRLRAMADPRVWLLIAIYFTVAMGTNAIGFFLPKILEGHFPGASKLRARFPVGLAAPGGGGRACSWSASTPTATASAAGTWRCRRSSPRRAGG